MSSAIDFSEENSTRARDLHLLKKLRCAIRDHVNAEAKLLEKVTEVGRKLSTVVMIREAIRHLINAAHISPLVMGTFLSLLNDSLTGSTSRTQTEEGEESLTDEKEELLQAVTKLQSVTRFYEYISSMHDVPPAYTCVVDSGDVTELEVSAIWRNVSNCLIMSSTN